MGCWILWGGSNIVHKGCIIFKTLGRYMKTFLRIIRLVMIYNGLRSQTCLQIKASKDFVQAIKVKFNWLYKVDYNRADSFLFCVLFLREWYYSFMYILFIYLFFEVKILNEEMSQMVRNVAMETFFVSFANLRYMLCFLIIIGKCWR